MGCWQSCNRDSRSVAGDATKILQAINLGSTKRLSALLSYFKSVSTIEVFDSVLIRHGNIMVNALGLCLLQNRFELFRLLIENNCSPALMEEILSRENISVIHTICIEGYVEILKIYFPYYLQINRLQSENSYSLVFSQMGNIPIKGLPIHAAAHAGQVSVIAYFYEYFSELVTISSDFDVNSKEEVSGENCALIACKEGHYNLVKYLYENTNADFKILNDSKENAIMVAVAGMRRKASYSYIDIVEYLVEKVKLDIKYMFEELLIMAYSPVLIKYIEDRLHGEGIASSKESVEKLNPNLKRALKTEEETSSLEVFFTNSFVEDLENLKKQSVISTISMCSESIDLDNQIIESLLLPE
ncbi:hypothetical protein SteCoe_6460 [Stentor coeruleus]|uniref:Uncharacterized protein n=1 Tax=Stentor coeruleus TaxID=5963 RepID=A0A1R2CQ14_9CILI|nr:hypothetical protein SteCoe_6460 [Stentor coeruleus]